MSDFLKKGDAKFNDGYRNLCQYVTKKTSGQSPAWGHISEAEVDALNKGYINWTTSYEPCLKPHTPVETQAKNSARKVAEKEIRLFKHRNLDYRPDVVTDADFLAMGFEVKDLIPTPQGPPEVGPEILVENTRVRRQHKVKTMNPLNGTTGKPKGVHGVCFAWQVGGVMPASGEALPEKKFNVPPYRIFTYSEDKKGLPVYYACCYENRKGDRGPWSIVEEAFIS